jgi:hypothetical protein
MARSLNDHIEQGIPSLGVERGNLVTWLNRTYDLGRNRLLGNPALAIDTNFDVKNGSAYDYMLGGLAYSDAANGNCDTGTTATFPTTTWGIFKVSVDSSGTLTATWATNSSAGYATEALAIAALPDTPSGELCIGYVTVQAHGTGQFLAGTDALQGGSGGDVSQDTNYYNSNDPNVAPADPDAET